ncbi:MULTISPECIES: COG4705 family protein [Phyllobacteriaceae]|jgi:uncharacterized membrane-anchored protein|uniref:Membrane-anchored protein n=1 Tax=Mesorhizobium hungaricum TaxID=1566387 RepID=A0A1C2E129_9HYPH|nr:MULTISPECIES: hypothetical protein [Mesorhizobium]MBN9235558.1 hypothetical protein [Mesorhizobium sp.]MDQ0331288.1 putative membrane-anchored protein [Mesorhizobium sp. YL-MeA3-2017]OCX20689.1 hypothetical protein QV13_08430 [Mesorhizobium hungaricum]
MPNNHDTKEATLLNKVPEVTIYFWIIKILATTVGETAADLLAVRLDWGLTMTSWIMSGAFIIALIAQLRAKRYIPVPYWLTVVLISVVGTLISDNLVDGMGVSLVTTTVAFAAALIAAFALWYRSERTLSIHTIITRRRELYYWAAILFTFALGTSAGDLMAEKFDLGYGLSAIVFAAMIAVTYATYLFANISPILAFWIAYILTRPVGASIGDFLAKPVIAGGLGWGTINTSLLFLGGIFALVAFLTVSKVDRIESAPSEA